MADLITTKATFPKSGGLAVADGAVSVNAGNGLRVNPSTGMVEVPVDTTAGLGYGSNGLEVEVDGSTIDFNASGQLTALGGGGSGSAVEAAYTTIYDGKPAVLGSWNIAATKNSEADIICLYSDKWLYIAGIGGPSSSSAKHIRVTNTRGVKLNVNSVDYANTGEVCRYKTNTSITRDSPAYEVALLTFVTDGFMWPTEIYIYENES